MGRKVDSAGVGQPIYFTGGLLTLLRSAVERGRGFEALTPPHQRRQARASWLYGQWLQQEAVRYGLPVVTPHPWETLAERIVNVIQ